MMTEFFVRLLTKAGPAWLVGRWAFHPIAACRTSATPGFCLGLGRRCDVCRRPRPSLCRFLSYRTVSYRIVSCRIVVSARNWFYDAIDRRGRYAIVSEVSFRLSKFGARNR